MEAALAEISAINLELVARGALDLSGGRGPARTWWPLWPICSRRRSKPEG